MKQLRSKIKATGPITVAEYMKEVLVNPRMGYYMRGDVFGQQGDFITSPEISQLFGELIGVWCLHEWFRLGTPSPFQVVELGPGRGTLMQDMIRVFSKFSDPKKLLTVHLVEISPKMRKLQETKLCGTSASPENTTPELKFCKQNISVNGVPIFWYTHIEDVPAAFSCFIAHEFFDALPIHKFQVNFIEAVYNVLSNGDSEV